jgi:hypothetical protein
MYNNLNGTFYVVQFITFETKLTSIASESEESDKSVESASVLKSHENES